MKRIGFVLLIGLCLRLIGIAYGLPGVFNTDEPHLVNVAVSFGAGTLNPHFFKYPTLWMYALFFCYGIYFACWSGFGLLHSVRQFGELYVWNPTGFYLIARVLSAAASFGALERVIRTARLLGDSESGVWAGALLAVSPYLVDAAHAAKPDSLMLFFAAWAWWFAARYRTEGRDRDLILCGLAVGLAASTQYTAMPLAVLVPIAAWSRRGRWEKAIWPACFGVGAGFLLGSPFILLDYKHFWEMIQDQKALAAMGDRGRVWKVVGLNILTFGGPWFSGGLAWIAGGAYLCARDRRRAAFLLAPVAVFWACLSTSAEGTWYRYLFGVYPALAVAAGLGIETFLARLPARVGGPARAAALAALLAPGGLASAEFDRELLLPQTQWTATHWIEANVPQGTKILLDQEAASPQLRMTPEEAKEMLEKTKALGNPRWRYYEYMLSGHPGGGYWIYRVLRDPRDLHTNPRLAALSAEGHPTLDVRGGLAAARAAGVRVVALTSGGANPENSPELADFLAGVEREGRLLAEFSPEPGRRTGPRIRIYGI